MGSRCTTFLAALTVLAVCAIALAADFDWNWHSQETIGRTDSSVNNTSRLTEPERAALIDTFVLRLQKPMSERGYDDDRIREIASTTRLRFVDLGGDKPFVFATSLGLEGGCDVMANCPLWIFRHSDVGYVSVLDTDGASFTIQPTSTNGVSDLVIMRHESASESHLTLYSYADGKYSEAGCYIATWPPPKDGETQDPTITVCKPQETKPDEATPAEPKAEESKPAPPNSDEAKPAEPKTEESKPAAPATDETKPAEPTPDQPKRAEPKSDEEQPDKSTTTEPQPAAPAADPTKPDQPKPPDTKGTP